MIVYVIIGIIVLFLLFILLLKKIKNKLYFHPFPALNYTTLDGVKDVWVKFNDKGDKLHCWYYPSPNKEKTLLFCHGNAGNIGIRRGILQNMINNGISFFIFDYRGFGKSDGRTFMESIYEDANICYKYLKDKLKIKDITILGESIGSYPASKLAKTYDLKKLILIGGINSIYTVVESLIPIFFVKWLVLGDFNVGDNLNGYKGKTMLMHSPTDRIVNIKNAVKNLNICGKDKCKLVKVKGGHNSMVLDWNEIKSFISN